MKTTTLLLATLAPTVPTGLLAAEPSTPLAIPEAVQDDEPTMQEADALLAAGDTLAAAAAYGKIAEAQPENARAHHLKGYCLHLAGELEQALEAHLEAAEFPSVRPVALYNCACVHALQERPDAAFEFLEKAMEAGFSNADQLVVDSDMDNLRGDPRFEEILEEMRGGAAGPVDLSQMSPARRFDFWIGSWETVSNGQVYGTATVERTFGGRGLRQVAKASDGTMRSISNYVFDSGDGKWRQVWMDGEGSYAVLEGGLEDDRMVLTMTSLDGQPRVAGRSVFSNITAEGFDYRWQTSEDGGETWSEGTPVRFRKAAN